jgi:TPR repeat protein
MVRRLLSAIMLFTGCSASPTAHAGAPGIDQAMEDYSYARYVKAESAFRAAAEQGDVRAQEILGFMYAFGPDIYPGIRHDRHEAAVWFGRAARAGSESAQYMYCALTRHSATYRLRSAPCSMMGKGDNEQVGRK